MRSSIRRSDPTPGAPRRGVGAPLFVFDFESQERPSLCILRRFELGTMIPLNDKNQTGPARQWPRLTPPTERRLTPPAEPMARRRSHYIRWASVSARRTPQRSLISKWRNSAAQLFLFDEPTGDVDVGVKAEICRLLASCPQKGRPDHHDLVPSRSPRRCASSGPEGSSRATDTRTLHRKPCSPRRSAYRAPGFHQK
jgi:hypothetical protein